MRQVGDRPEICEELESLSQLNVNAGKAATNRRSHRTLQADAGTLDRLGQFLGNVLFVFFEGLGASRETLPLKFDASCFQNADGSLRDFRANTVAGDEGDFMCHELVVWGGHSCP